MAMRAPQPAAPASPGARPAARRGPDIAARLERRVRAANGSHAHRGQGTVRRARRRSVRRPVSRGHPGVPRADARADRHAGTVSVMAPGHSGARGRLRAGRVQGGARLRGLARPAEAVRGAGARRGPAQRPPTPRRPLRRELRVPHLRARRAPPARGGYPSERRAGRGSTVLVPLGSADSVAVINNAGLCTTGLCVRPVVVFPLARGSGATGVAVQDDSIAWVANPGLNTVTRINYLTGDTTSRPVGVFPRAVTIVRGRVFVANANIAGGSPAGASWLTAFPCCGGGGASDSIPLTGANARGR